MLETSEVAKMVGISYHQIKYWRHYLPEGVQPGKGGGANRLGYLWNERSIEYIFEVKRMREQNPGATWKHIKTHLQKLYDSGRL